VLAMSALINAHLISVSDKSLSVGLNIYQYSKTLNRWYIRRPKSLIHRYRDQRWRPQVMALLFLETVKCCKIRQK